MTDDITARISEVIYQRMIRKLGYRAAGKLVCDDLAEIIVKELDLTRETRRLDDGMGGATYHADGTTTVHMRAQTQEHRWVTGWVRADTEEPT
jgi:hypothetical protein